jgi:hypothetical protein
MSIRNVFHLPACLLSRRALRALQFDTGKYGTGNEREANELLYSTEFVCSPGVRWLLCSHDVTVVEYGTVLYVVRCHSAIFDFRNIQRRTLTGMVRYTVL